LFLVRFISAVLLSGSWSWKPDFLGFLGNRRLQPSTTPGTLPGNPENRVNRDPDYAAARRVPIVRNCGLFRRAARVAARPLILGAS
ncbi:hypothetical protein, partial [Burkholderia cenocepacia]|uniref:hypothetical protein n=1 Tax=Burkholderia cenocepacia TaxID=95486 RepID=UPI001B8ECA67